MKIAKGDNSQEDWQLNPMELQAIHSQQRRPTKWSIKQVKETMEENNTIMTKFKTRMMVVLRGRKPYRT